MVAYDDAGISHSRYQADHGFRSHLSLVLDDHDAALLDRFSGEVKSSAISCINIGSCYNAAGFSKNFQLPADIVSFAPSYPHSFAEIKGSALFQELTPPVRSCLTGFRSFLRGMREELTALLEIAAARPITRHDVANARDVTNSAACFAKLALKDLASIEARLNSEYEVAHMSYLVALLDDILEGKSPLLVDGRLEKAKTDFLLRERRVEINAEAIVWDPAIQERVIVSNVSQGGVSFRCDGDYAAGQKIRLRLMTSGRELLGHIVWRKGRKVGVAFYQPLELGDDLLIAA